MGAAVFLNEGAGGARTDRVRRAVELTRVALDADVHVTASRNAAEFGAWLSERIAPYGTAVIAGGDGSLGVAFGIAASRADRGDLALGFIPAGFGNATRHLLRLPGTPEEQVAVLVRGDARAVDLVAIDDRLALFAGAGWDALVAGRYAAAGARRLPGWAAAIARSIPDLWRQPRVEVRADGWVVHRGRIELLVVGTTPFYGRGLKVNPGARPDSGTLALRVYPGPAPRLAAEAARWALRMTPAAERIDARVVELHAIDGDDVPVQVDGDVIGTRADWRFEVRPQAVRLIGRWA
jgi:diacylglycerol kinase family enzyme